jgi:Tfp pilus assembly protein PilV
MSNKSMDHKFLLFLCRSRSLPPDSGLSMLEVLVAMMVVFLTFMTSLNGLLYAAMFQVKGDRQAKAVYWIQQDVEQIKSIAASTTNPPIYANGNTQTCTGTPNSCCTTTISGSTVTGGFANALRVSTLLPSLTITTPANPNNPKPFFGKDYTMTRTPSVSPTNPQVLRITYTVRNSSDTSDLATLYTEILPAAALSCS